MRRPTLKRRVIEGLHVMLRAGPPVQCSAKDTRRYIEAETWIRASIKYKSEACAARKARA